MRKIFLLTAILLSISIVSLSAATSKINVSRGTYTVIFTNIEEIGNISFDESDTVTFISNDGISVSLKGKQISVKGSNGTAVLSGITFPKGRKFLVKNDDSVIVFSDTDVKIETDGGTSVIEKTQDGLYIRNEDDVVRITDREISVNSNDSKVNVSDKGIIIKDNGEEISLGIIGKLISKITKTVVGKTLRKDIDNIELISDSLNDIINNRDIVVEYSSIKIGSTDTDYKTEVTEYSYKNVDSLDISLISSDLTVKNSTDKNTTLKIIKKYVPKEGYKIKLKQDGGTLSLKEDIRGRVKKLSVDFILYVPKMKEIKIRSTSGDVLFKNVDAQKTLFNTTSGNITMFDFKGDTMDLKLTSGDYYMNNIKLARSFDIYTVSGDGKLSKITTPSADIRSTSGDIKGISLNSGEVTIKTISGDCYFSGLETQKLIFRSTSGDLKTTESTIGEFSGKSVSGDASFTNTKIRKKTFSSVSGTLETSRANNSSRPAA